MRRILTLFRTLRKQRSMYCMSQNPSLFLLPLIGLNLHTVQIQSEYMRLF
jgi:hypothetical protein